MTKKLASKLEETLHPARLWDTNPERPGGVICRLSPRNCKIADGSLGFCGVRKNVGGKLMTLNYGKMVHPTVEVIETEAVAHYAPGEKILSMGNIGCMMVCDFCHNWKTSQARLAEDKDINIFTPEEIVDYAEKLGIRMLSWTYNDPVVWQEFVVDTARLARKRGIQNLYKSAFYISPKAIDELIEVMDIFSLSLKSMDPKFYLEHTGGKLQPVLDGIVQVYKSGRHLEVSNLLVTGRNDNLPEAAKIAHWMLENTDASVPLHYVRFHPDFKYLNVERTSIPFIAEACKQAKKIGMKHVYMGNVFEGAELHTHCECGNLLVHRTGLTIVSSMDAKGNCPKCQRPSPIKVLPPRKDNEVVDGVIVEHNPYTRFVEHVWEDSKINVHVTSADANPLIYQGVDADGRPTDELRKALSGRFMVSRSAAKEIRRRIYYKDVAPKVLALMDRANFPVA